LHHVAGLGLSIEDRAEDLDVLVDALDVRRVEHHDPLALRF